MVFKEEKKQEEFLAKIRREEEESRAKIFAEKTNTPYLDLAFMPVESDALKLIPKQKSLKAGAAIINKEYKNLNLAVLNPDTQETRLLISELQNSGYVLKIFIVSQKSLNKALSQYPEIKEVKKITGRFSISGDYLSGLQKKITDAASLSGVLGDLFRGKTTQIVEAILAGALALQASDIHFEPEEGNIRVRLRLDGILEDITRMPPSGYPALLNRIKLLSGLKINISKKAQDGRFSVVAGDNPVEVRTSVLPGAYGENIVMRVLDPRAIKIEMEDLGIRADDLAIISKEITRPTGMILVTGPTGSGKTTTLYAFIKKILSPDIKIITIEDPIEYHIDGVSQTQVEPDKGYTFDNGLKSIVRQDPDVILVGEIRDYETAEISMHAALTGHLVFSTLHTNDAVGAIPRLIDLGVKPPVIAPAVNLVIAQRLVRRVCRECAVKRLLTKIELQNFKSLMKNLPPRAKLKIKLNEKTEVLKPTGCEKCRNGYSGRIAIIELFEVTDNVENLILKSPTEAEIRNAAGKEEMVAMAQDAAIKILSGETTVEEAERVFGSFN